MEISANIDSKKNNHIVRIGSNGTIKQLIIDSGIDGYGSSVNGGEFLLLSLATCFCNDIYREAKKKNIKIKNVKVQVTCEFTKEGEPGFNFKYNAKIDGNASDEVLNQLIKNTDKVAEIHNTLRKGVEITLVKDSLKQIVNDTL